MLELEDALGRIVSQIEPLTVEGIPLSQASSRYSASAIVSPTDLPPFDNSAMDGYAVIASDLSSATPEAPGNLRVVGTVAAGQIFPGIIKPGECVRIFTGSPLPQGADAVVIQEDTSDSPNGSGTIQVIDSVKPWENVRFRGEDVRTGTSLLPVGGKITPPIRSLLSAAGLHTLSVHRRPFVGLLATGSELLEPGNPLKSGQIYESNRLGLAGFTENAGGIPKLYPLVPDTLEETVKAIETAFAECDVVVTSGGVSVGEFDVVKAAFEKVGGQLSFWKVAIKPGKPFVFGRWRDKFLFGVPGNPVSALVTFFLLVRPAILKMQGATRLSPQCHFAQLKESVSNRGNRRHFIRVRVDEEGYAQPTGIQASHILTSLAQSDGLLDVPPGAEFPQGSTVRIIPWNQ